MKITRKADSFAILSSRAPDPFPDSIPTHKSRNQSPSRWKSKNPARSVAGLRVRRDGSAPVGRRSRPETPLLRWKYNEGENDVRLTGERLFPPECGRRSGRKTSGKEKVTAVSARKLAGVLWRMNLPETPAAIPGQENDTPCLPKNSHLGFQRTSGQSQIPFESQDLIQNRWSIPSPKNGHLCKYASSFKPSNSALEGATKWNPISSNISEDIRQIYGDTDCNIELEQARARIHELESEKKSSKKKLEHFLKKLSEERTVWRNKEHEKIRLVIDDMKGDLNKEKKTRQRLEIVNSKLVSEIADAKLLAKRYMMDYDKERKARVIIEQVCDELAKEIGEDKEETEAMKKEYLKLREEVDDERKMLQMAEVWREERVQMKLVDIKVAIEERYSYMNQLVSSLEEFLNSGETLKNIDEIKKAESLCQAARLVSVQDIVEFKYEPPKSDDIFAVFEDMNMGDIEEDESGWETVSHLEEEEQSNYSHDGSDPSVNNKGTNRDSNFSEENGSVGTPITETVVSGRKVKKGSSSSSISRLWRLYQNNSSGEKVKIISVDANNNNNGGRLSNGTAVSMDGEWSSPDVSNPHINRGIKGCIEWPIGGGLQKGSLKSKLLEARMESQKIQLRQALKQRI
ncbi:uncharacterized protein LOC124935689 [Impatiens glandulifera]|uniref:uncharacterized protein LOC124935689 n=1 Tax=Impatiens glandulifera TaxID=253017 RepID=UPI001FB14019|nr:uncharacterized protein LOC124935689 [Impatiens glandulifera]